ncbi:Uncharacterised protein [Burkholderia pseudomallei]|uniref:hypothetical protein n=1 Tax=Burkholderia pseudomallei TaxID=28450 RepID=UPI0005E6566D|nr:hypothetical protein [Burkholderia pseudomallei]CAJ9926343.1 Uncharacterised protein [Burkholderia pseudomallei]CAK1307518.1 Uncharacterised protein [Burkholderia pseudomallei]CPG54689.1 Uncharacterised protein [Burkholderia pseudomallei]
MNFLRKLFAKKVVPTSDASTPAARPDPMQFAVKASPERIIEEASVKAEVYAALPDALRATGAFQLDAIDGIVAELHRHESAFRPVSAHPLKMAAPFPVTDGRMTTLGECLMAESAGINAVKLIDRIAGDLTNRIQRKYDLKRWAAMGIEKVKIIPGKPSTCSNVERMRKVHPIDAVPEIPLAGCAEKFCFCTYHPLIEGVDYHERPQARQQDIPGK